MDSHQIRELIKEIYLLRKSVQEIEKELKKRKKYHWRYSKEAKKK